jgi:lipopolysaccharide transport system ATP-binding protein
LSTVIKVENISKQYRLGDVGTGALAHDVNKWWYKVRGKENPYLKIGEANDRATKGESDYVWALKDINFEVKQGEVLGIIGRNGAGKSTLLKILSKTTTPTTGSIKIKGRIASLLEVGTGFHPELSGRENIFLNGAILGMTKQEIKSKFDEIVDFAGVERYIDTPVKRYSSGMYVRLAFGVAAHLEPEILIVDEVLAVGDAEFQKKAMGKMKDVSEKGGRTVLFVSHNMNAINRICNSGLLMSNGKLEFSGSIKEVIKKYTYSDININTTKEWDNFSNPNKKDLEFLSAKINYADDAISSKSYFDITKNLRLTIIYNVFSEGLIFTHGIKLFDEEGVNVFDSHDVTSNIRNEVREKGIYTTVLELPGNLLREGNYSISIALFKRNPVEVYLFEEEVLRFTLTDELRGDSARGDYYMEFPGIIRPLLEWRTQKIK